MNKNTLILYTRNFIFGAEDSLVSTVGLLAGIVSAGIAQKEIIVSGIILIFVEAFSMSVGSFLSERTTEESEIGYKSQNSNSLHASLIMLISYFICGLIPLAPYFFMDIHQAFWFSIFFSLFSLLILGYISARILQTNILRTSIRMMIIGGLAIGLGVIVGVILKI